MSEGGYGSVVFFICEADLEIRRDSPVTDMLLIELKD